ncbi:MAG: hypothetical protein NZM15_07850 [Flavobacteriales bacterium]|nr:hypothetical protein [Flavobacteriales bacterium]MDW8432599.1 hypothetical protein [Flavobacteriales bacterium]
MDFLLPRLFLDEFSAPAWQKNLTLGASNIGSIITACIAFIIYYNKPSWDEPRHYKKILLTGLLSGLAGMALTVFAIQSHSVWTLFWARWFLGVGFTLVNIALLPIIFATQDSHFHAFWVFFILGFSSLGRFIAYPVTYFSMTPEVYESKVNPNIVGHFYLALCCITLITIFLISSRSLHLTGFIHNPGQKIRLGYFFTPSVITGIIGASLLVSFEFFITGRSELLLHNQLTSYGEILALASGLAIVTGNMVVGRFSISLKLSHLPFSFKNIFIFLIPLSIIFFISWFLIIMDTPFQIILLNLIIFFIFLLILYFSPTNYLHIYNILILSLIIQYFITYILLKGTTFEAASLFSSSLFRSVLWPGLVLMIFQSTNHSRLALSSLLSISSGTRVLLNIPDNFIKTNYIFSDAGYLFVIAICFYYLWVGNSNRNLFKSISE